MENTKKWGLELYQNLGKLFYAVANADQRIHKKEIDKLRSFVRKYWLDVDEVEDDFGTDAAFQIESVFDWLLEKENDSDSCYEDFEEFYNEESRLFNPFIKDLILDTANAIANSFSGKNKAELVMLGKLQILLKE